MQSPSALCINPWIYDFAAYDHWSKPLGLLYLAALLRKRGVHVEFLDCLDKWHPELLRRQRCTAPKLRPYGIGPFHREVVPTPACVNFLPRYFARYGLPEDIVRAEIQNRARPDAILVTSFMTYWYMGPQRVVEICRDIFPGVPILFGGIYASLMPEHASRVVKPDYLLTGPGEYKVTELLADLFHTPALPDNFPVHIDDFPYPAFDLLRKNDYLIVMTSRGCPFRCTFCATYKVDSVFSQRRAENVVEEIVTQTHRFQVHDVAFYDDALLMQSKQRIKPILQAILESKCSLRFHTPNGLHARYIDEELADLMYRCHLITVRLSLESVAKERLRDIHNKITPGEMTQAVRNLVKAGYNPRDLETYVIMGLPHQPPEEVIETILYANSLGIQIRLSAFSPIPGTKDYERAVEDGYFPADADPLLTNNTIMPLYRTAEAYQRFHTIAQLTKLLNDGVRRGVSVCRPGELRQVFSKALDRFRTESPARAEPRPR
jgi:radical SAM superfamily enzyme YgiQ (UPF0313 family)